jgi:hypothetical protein
LLSNSAVRLVLEIDAALGDDDDPVRRRRHRAPLAREVSREPDGA